MLDIKKVNEKSCPVEKSIDCKANMRTEVEACAFTNSYGPREKYTGVWVHSACADVCVEGVVQCFWR